MTSVKITNMIEIGLMIYPGAQLAAAYGLSDLFSIANRMTLQAGGDSSIGLRISHWQLLNNEMVCSYDSHPDSQHKLSVIIVLPSLEEVSSQAMISDKMAAWLKSSHAGGTALASICAGAFLLGETGLLNGRTVTTHWVYQEKLAKRFPNVMVDTNKLIIDDGDILTAGGLMAWTDLGLRLVDRFLGPTITVQTARFLLIDPVGRDQRHYSSFSPRLDHGDTAILKVQHWLQTKGAKDVSVESMAVQAGMEMRTFLRRFQLATKLKPTEYCQHIRVSKAQQILEFTNNSIEQIAWNVGYEDTGAFRKVFQRIVGLSPGDYRKRFSLKFKVIQ